MFTSRNVWWHALTLWQHMLKKEGFGRELMLLLLKTRNTKMLGQDSSEKGKLLIVGPVE